MWTQCWPLRLTPQRDFHCVPCASIHSARNFPSLTQTQKCGFFFFFIDTQRTPVIFFLRPAMGDVCCKKKNSIQIEFQWKKKNVPKNQALSCHFLEGRQALLPHFQWIFSRQVAFSYGCLYLAESTGKILGKCERRGFSRWNGDGQTKRGRDNYSAGNLFEGDSACQNGFSPLFDRFIINNFHWCIII